MPALSFDLAVILGIVAVYLVLVLGIGSYAARRTGDSREDYLMASRSFGTLVLIAALFATNMSAVTMIGAPGLSYNIGPSALGYFVGLFPFIFSVLILTAGRRIWLVGKKFGPVFEMLVEHDLPLLLHGSLAYWPQHSYIGDEMLTWTEILGFDWPIYAIVNVANMIMRGVFDRFPNLNVVLQEAGH